jgi:mycothiol synthase
VNELSRAARAEEETTTEEVRDWFALSSGMDFLVAERPDGRVVAYADMYDAALDHVRFWIDLRVPPIEDGAAVGAALLDALERRAAKDALPGATLRVTIAAGDEGSRECVEAAGYERFKHSFRMRIDFDGDLPAPEWPAGVTVRTFVRGQDDEAVWKAHQEAFADGFEHSTWPYEGWREWAFSESFDPSLWFVAEEGEEIAGVCLCKSHAGRDGELGWVNVLGVRRPWRRRGLGRGLLLNAFAEFRRRGSRGAGLGVDGLNPTGAVRLYEQAGMYVASRLDQFKKPLSR